MDSSLASMLPRVFISMAVVVIVMWIAARISKNRQDGGSSRMGIKASSRPAVVQVLGRSGVGKNAAVSVVRAGDKTLVVGITDQQITLLAELDDEMSSDAVTDITERTQQRELDSRPQWTGVSASSTSQSNSEQTWKGLLEQVRERTVRRA